MTRMIASPVSGSVLLKMVPSGAELPGAEPAGADPDTPGAGCADEAASGDWEKESHIEPARQQNADRATRPGISSNAGSRRRRLVTKKNARIHSSLAHHAGKVYDFGQETSTSEG